MRTAFVDDYIFSSIGVSSTTSSSTGVSSTTSSSTGASSLGASAAGAADATLSPPAHELSTASTVVPDAAALASADLVLNQQVRLITQLLCLLNHHYSLLMIVNKL